MMITLFVITVILFTIMIAQFYWSKRHMYRAVANMEGPKAYPIIGNALAFFCDTEDIHERIKIIFGNIQYNPMRFWLGTHLLVVLKNPVHLEKIMSSQKFAYKHDLYIFMEKVSGEGLIAASGLNPKYKVHRRIIQPMFDIKFVNKSLTIINPQADECMKKMEGYINGETFDVLTFMGPCSVLTMCELVLGQKLDMENVDHQHICHSISRLLYIILTRMLKVWLHSDIVFNWHSLKKEQDKTLEIIYNFIDEAIIDSWIRRKINRKEDQFVPIIDSMTEFVENYPDMLSPEDLRSQLITLMGPSEDTISIITSFSIVCFGMYPDYQEKAAEEIQKVIGKEPRNITVDDTYNLVYLDMCVKDVMRLFPIAPMILRKNSEDYYLDKWIIPKGAAIAVPIYFLHRDPGYWENPEHFHPDHFLPEIVRKRHPYAYLPYSAGPRGCIAKTMSNIQIKIILAKFLQLYEVEANGKVPDLKLKTDISTRPKYGYNCRIRRRVWNKN